MLTAYSMLSDQPVYDPGKIINRFAEFKRRHATYDKPTVRQLEAIGIIEFWLSELFNTLFSKPLKDQEEKLWKERCQTVRKKIEENCPPNLECKQALYYLDAAESTARVIAGIGENRERLESHINWLLVYFENTRDWSRKSVIRGNNIT